MGWFRRKENPASINSFETRVFSQNGEDGILEMLFSRLPRSNEYFVEFGSSDGTECNCAYLAKSKGWSGLFIEKDEELFDRLTFQFNRLETISTVNASVNRSNIESILASNQVPTALDLLSIDIDGNDYWVWKAITHYRPRVVVIEYNAAYPPPQRWVMCYDENHQWDGTDYYGASLSSLALLARTKGYVLLGTDSMGVNAFFIEERGRKYVDLPVLSPAAAFHPLRHGVTGAGHPHRDGPAEHI